MKRTDTIDPETAITIAGLFRERVRRTPQGCAYRRFNEKEGRFEAVTWEEVSRLAAAWQIALRRERLSPGDRVAVMLKNCLEWVLFDLAALGLGLVTVPLFANDRPENSSYILEETGARFIFIEREEQWLRILQIGASLTAIARIVTLYPADPANRKAVAPNAWLDSRLTEMGAWLPGEAGNYVVNCGESTGLATIVYTSGTTGMPKGVMLSHSNILENAFACIQRESVYPDDVFLSFLPLSHTFERTVGYYIPMMAGACVAHVRSNDKIPQDLLAVRPTVLISVPRIYERIHRKIVVELKERSFPVRLLFRLTVRTGWTRFLHIQGQGSWAPLLLFWPLLKKIMASRVMNLLGGRLRLSISGGAPLAFSVGRFFIGLGLNLLQGYGLTETSPVVAVNATDDNLPATVGRLLPGMAAAVASNGELLVKGPNVMLGYWNNGEATRAAVGSDGFFHTGDLAFIDPEGRISIAGRLKEIIVLSTGEKVSPEDLETAIAVNPLFEQVMIVGENRPYLAALIVLNRPQWEKTAARHGIAGDRLSDLNGNPVQEILLPEIEKQLARFPGHAHVRKVRCSLSPWTMQEELLTATMKLRRKELLAVFEREVEELFEGH